MIVRAKETDLAAVINGETIQAIKRQLNGIKSMPGPLFRKSDNPLKFSTTTKWNRLYEIIAVLLLDEIADYFFVRKNTSYVKEIERLLPKDWTEEEKYFFATSVQAKAKSAKF